MMMRKTILLFAILISVAGATYAQKGKVASAQTLKDSQKLDKALEAINEATDPNNEKAAKATLEWPKTWEVRGDIFRAIYQSKDANVKKLAADPLKEALESYKKALALDDKGRNANAVKIQMTLLIQDFTDQAVKHFNDNKYENALESFKSILEIEGMPLMKDDPVTVDTVIIFNAGLAAYNAEKYDEAVKYYKEAAKYDYNGARTFELIASSYINQADTIQALATLKEGFEKYPDNSSIMVLMINLYLGADKKDEAMKYLDLAIKQDPENATFYFARGSLYDKLERTDDAVQSYEKAIELNPEYFDAYYNLGAIYYNRGVKQIEVSNSVPSNQHVKYEEEKNKADVEFKKAIPYMEKASEVNPEDTYSLESLKNLYYRLKMMDKYDEVNKKLEDMK